MPASGTSRLKVNAPLGRMPVLQFMQPGELAIDPGYQRSIEAGDSQALIRKIAQHWNWDLCQPLVVSRRPDGRLFVIDGQHRLAAARLRRDITLLPCVVVDYADPADEAASFVHLNQRRKPLNAVDLFKAALASGDEEACAIMAAIERAGLSLAPHSNPTAWKPGMITCMGGLRRIWRSAGPETTSLALVVLGKAWKGEILRYSGTIFPGIVHALARQADADRLREALAAQTQSHWARDILRRAPDCRGGRREAAHLVVGEAVGLSQPAAPQPAAPEPARPKVNPALFVARAGAGPKDAKTAWCEQCEMRVTQAQAEGCRSRWCSLRDLAPQQSAAA